MKQTDHTLLKISQLNYKECPAAKSPGNFRKKMFVKWCLPVNLLWYFVKKGN